MRGLGVAVAVLVLVSCSADDTDPVPVSPVSPVSTGPATEVPTVPTFGSAPADPGVDGVSVIDGDTLEVGMPGGRVERVRLVGINTPEDGECLADEAADRLAELLGEGEPQLVRDVSDRDQYGRLLRHVLVDGRSVGEQLVAEGLALSRAYPPDTGQQARLDAAQERARAAGIGLWAPDACGPATGDAIQLGAVEANPPGDESLTPNEEWIEVVNASDHTVDLTGWGVRDESASHRFSFPDGFRLAPGAIVRIHTGCGRGTAAHLYWCITGSAVWNNDGDTAFVTDPSGNVVDERSV